MGKGSAPAPLAPPAPAPENPPTASPSPLPPVPTRSPGREEASPVRSPECEEASPVRSLFGGAMQARVPARFQDLSEFRQIPDNQEVLADGHVDQSIVVELLELKADVADAQAATWFFLDLCREQDSEEAQCEVESVCELAQGQVPHLEQTSSSNNTGIGSNNNMGMDSSMNSGIASNVNSGIASNVNSAIDPNMNSGSIFKACAVGRMLVSKSREGLEAGNLVRCYLAVIRLRGVGTDLLVSLYDPLVISESSSSAEALGAGPVSQNGTGARSAKEVFETLLATLQINDWGLFGA